MLNGTKERDLFTLYTFLAMTGPTRCDNNMGSYIEGGAPSYRQKARRRKTRPLFILFQWIVSFERLVVSVFKIIILGWLVVIVHHGTSSTIDGGRSSLQTTNQGTLDKIQDNLGTPNP
jgi:hypothetical protein